MAKLKLEIGANISALQAGLGQAKNAVKNFANSIAGQLTGMLGAASLIAFGKSAIDAADQVADGSKRIGVSAEEYQKLRYAAEQSGAGVENVEVAFKKMNGVVQDAINGDAKAIEKINALGISMDELAGKSQYEIFELMTDALGGFTDKAKAGQLATEMFGKSGMSLVPLMGNLKSLGDEAKSVGAIMSDEAVKAADEFNDSLNKLSTTLKAGLVNSGFVEYLKSIADEFSALIGMSKTMKEAMGKGIEVKEAPKSPIRSAIISALKSNPITASTGYAIDWVDKYTNPGITSGKKSTAEEQKQFNSQAKVKPPNRQAKADELEQKAMAAEARANLDKQRQGYEKEEREGAKKAEEALSDSIQKMQQKIELQKLLNKGLDREAAIMQAVNDAKDKAGKDIFGNQREIDPEKLKQIEALAGQEYDLTKEHIKPLQMEAPTITDSVKRIGGSIGGASNVNYAKDQLQVQKDISTVLKEVKERMVAQQAGNVWA